jgi:heme oxygenase
MFATDTLTPLAQQLKQQTAEEHLALEDLIVPQIKAVQSKDDYARLLHLFYGFNKPVEAAIHQIIDHTVLPDIDKRYKAHLLLEDLQSIGYVHHPQVCTAIPDINRIEEAFGALYVLEGSTLGGKSITQLLLKTSIGLQPSQLRFFNAYGKETGPMWVSFLSQLNAFATEEQQAVIIDTAKQTFIKFKQWIQQQVQQR